MKKEIIKYSDIKITDIVKIEATTQSVVIMMYNGDYINIQEKLEVVLSKLCQSVVKA